MQQQNSKRAVAWKSSSKKRKVASAQERAALGRLERVRAQREVFKRLSRRIVEGTLERYLPSVGAVVEIGSGNGQLQELLPETLLPRMTFTEPDAAVSRSFRKRCPRATVIQASAENLPLEPGCAAAVVGLCVLDEVADGPGVARELSRVLRPEGAFIHWLDMSTVLDSIVDSLWTSGFVPFPNWFGDPSASEWPEDLTLVPRDRVALVVAILRRAGIPIAGSLAQYLATFSSPPRAPGAPTAELIQLQESSTLRNALKTAFELAFELASAEQRARLVALSARPFSSAHHFERRLRGWFTPELGFRIVQSSVERSWETVPLDDPDVLYRSCCIGEQRHLSHVPDPSALLCHEATGAPPREALLELGVHTFVAIRT